MKPIADTTKWPFSIESLIANQSINREQMAPRCSRKCLASSGRTSYVSFSRKADQTSSLGGNNILFPVGPSQLTHVIKICVKMESTLSTYYVCRYAVPLICLILCFNVRFEFIFLARSGYEMQRPQQKRELVLLDARSRVLFYLVSHVAMQEISKPVSPTDFFGIFRSSI